MCTSDLTEGSLLLLRGKSEKFHILNGERASASEESFTDKELNNRQDSGLLI